MAATNYTPIQLYYSTTASQAPIAGNLTNGELAINITDGKLYYKDNGGVVQVIATKGAGTIGGSTTQIQYNNAGALAGNAAMTFNSGTNTTTLTTLNLTNALGATYGGTAQSAYTQGDVLYASATNTLSKLGIGTVNYILTSTGSVPQWVAPSSVTVQTANNLAGGAGGSVPYQSAADTTTFLAIGAANRVITSTGSAPQWVTSLTGLTGVSSSSITNTSLTSGRVILASTGGLEADSANLTFNGTTLSTTGLSNTGFSTLVKTLTLGDANFNGAAVFAPGTPAKMYMGAGTVTDVTSAASATNTTGAIASLAITPIAATNTAVTYTNASTLYIAGAPSAGTNITITNPYSLYVAAGASYFGGAVTYGAGLTLGGNLLFSPDNTYDIGASGATRPRSGYFGTNLTVGNNIIVGTASGSEYVYKPGIDTATGKLTIQSGAGSSGYGGGLILYSHSNASYPGWVMAGLSVGAAAKFAVNTWGTGGGTNVFTVDPTGLGYFASNVGIGTTPTTLTSAYALSVASYANFGQRTTSTAELIASWNAKFQGGTSGTGYTYLQTGDVAAAYEQNGSHRFWTTTTAGTAGGAISFTERFAVNNNGLVQSYGNTIVGVTTSGGLGAQTGLTVVGGTSVSTNTPGALTLGSHGNARNVYDEIGKIDFYSNDASGGASGVQASIRGVTLTALGDAAGLYFYTGTSASLNVAGAINNLQQWVFGAAGPDSNSRLTLYGAAGDSNALSIYETSTGNNARLRINQSAAAVYYNATYSSGGNSHNFQIGNGTVATIATTGLSVVGSGLFAAANGSGSLQIGTNAANQYQYINIGGNTGGENAWQVGKADTSATVAPSGALYFYDIKNSTNRMSLSTSGNLSLGTSSQDGRLTVAYGNESSGQVQIAQFRTEATGSTTYNAGMQIYGTASATAGNRLISVILDPDGANAAGADYVVFQKQGNNGNASLYNASNASFYFGTNSASTIQLVGANTYQLQGRKSNAYTLGNMQEWVGTVTNIANGATFALFYINNIYDNLCYELSMFCNAGGYFAYKSSGIFGYNGFTNTVLGSSTSQTITKTGSLYNETMTIQNNQGATMNSYIICLRVWGLSQSQSVSTGGQDCVVSSYLTRIQ
jgi:hypothetical protein